MLAYIQVKAIRISTGSVVRIFRVITVNGSHAKRARLRVIENHFREQLGEDWWVEGDYVSKAYFDAIRSSVSAEDFSDA